MLLVAFLTISGLLLRHAVKFGYLSPRFKIVVAIFGIISLAVIIFSISLIFQIGNSENSGYEYYNTKTESTSTGGLNF